MFKSLTAISLAVAFAGAQAEPVSYVMDPTHTFVTWEALHFGTSTLRGRFDKKEGKVTLDRAAKTGSVEVTIDTTSISSGVAPFDTHLKSKDFFNVAEHPTAKFVGDKFVFNGDKVAEVSGTLTLLGKSNPVTLKATNFNCYNHPMLKREVCGGDFETVLARSQYGMNYGLPAVSPDNVRLLVQIEAARQ
jgi:polyisoprenoid-binding protein YceI